MRAPGGTKFLGKFDGRRTLYRRERTADGRGIVKFEDGEESFEFEAWVSLRGLVLLGEKAAENKSGRSRHGALEVCIVSRKPYR